MNNYNIAIRDIRNKDGRIATLESEIEFLKTTPFIGIVSLIANIVATVMISIAVNFLTTENTGSKTIYIIILIG